MKSLYPYGEQMIGSVELTVTTSSMMISVGILSLPRLLAGETLAFDGGVSLLLTGMVCMLFGFLLGKLAAKFPEQPFQEYASRIVGKGISQVLTLGLGLSFLITTAFEIRSIASITKEYLFDRTPMEAIALFFLCVVAYAVSGTRVGLLRLNWLFLPPVLIITLLVQVMNLPIFDVNNLRPFFITPWTDILRGTEDVVLSFVGFAVVLPYSYLVRARDAKKMPKAIVLGIAIVLFLYLIIYVLVIGVFSNEGAQDILYPTIEIAKEIEVPGGFFERFESLFFTIWIMTIFNTSSMAFDVTVLSMGALFRKVKKSTWVFVLTPVIYLLALLPKSRIQVAEIGHFVGYLGLLYSCAIPTLLLLIARLRKVKASG